MKFYIGILIFTITLFGCKKSTKSQDSNYAYFGGQIINPKCNFIVLSKSEKILDTILLDGNYKFTYKINNLEAGFYTFRHADEFQMVFLEPLDSIMFRLNTLDFDESLVYTGSGAKKNNYLVNEFLQNEIDDKNLYQYCQLKPAKFEHQVDSIKDQKNKELAEFKEKYETSTFFNDVARANINYNYYFKKEIYPLYHYTKSKSELMESLPEGFYSYRKSINHNDSLLKDLFTYQSFLRTSISNLALRTHLNHSEDDNHVCYTLDKLKFIDSLIDNTSIKNDLLYYYTARFLAKNKNEKHSETIIESYLAKSNDDEKKKMIKQHALAIKNLKSGNYLPNVTIKDYQNNENNLNSKIQTPTVICFWSLSAYGHFKDSHNKIKELEIKYPEVTFMRINIDNYNTETIKKALKRSHLTLENEYLFTNPETAREMLAVYPMIKTFIVDRHKKIVNSNSNIFDRDFEEELLGAINR
ncbi:MULTISPECIES: hypothetical protein [Aestuariivivens]|uniref:TlpA family protein disulfide reductase n=1 Tax=Aestuariivivens TaxID=1820275 RepID=UPI001CBAD3C3|nr:MULTISPECIES: hypothetical protein [Aestuariivivens]